MRSAVCMLAFIGWAACAYNSCGMCVQQHTLPAACAYNSCAVALQRHAPTALSCACAPSPRSYRIALVQRTSGVRASGVAERSLATVLAYSTISAVWYLGGMALYLFSAAPPSRIAPDAVRRYVVQRLGTAWVITFAASQVTAPWRAAGALAVAPLVSKILRVVKSTLTRGSSLMLLPVILCKLALLDVLHDPHLCICTTSLPSSIDSELQIARDMMLDLSCWEQTPSASQCSLAVVSPRSQLESSQCRPWSSAEGTRARGTAHRLSADTTPRYDSSPHGAVQKTCRLVCEYLDVCAKTADLLPPRRDTFLVLLHFSLLRHREIESDRRENTQVQTFKI